MKLSERLEARMMQKNALEGLFETMSRKPDQSEIEALADARYRFDDCIFYCVKTILEQNPKIDALPYDGED